MKSLLFICLGLFLIRPASAQLLRPDDAVEVDVLMGDSTRNSWKKATVISYDSTTRVYKVKIVDGDKMDIVSGNPEKWIRPLTSRQAVVQFGPGARIRYQQRLAAIQPLDCRPAERYIKKNLRSQMAAHYKDFDQIHVDVSTVKPQKTEKDKTKKDKEVYPFKIEMLVHLKRTVTMGGKMYSEYQTWEYDREYAYAPGGKGPCDFYPLQQAGPKLLFRGWFVNE